MMPAPPYGVDQGSLDVVTPSLSNELWYDSPANDSAGVTATTMRLSLTYQYNSVALDQTIYLDSIVCSGSSLTVHFNDTKVYSYAAPIWRSEAQILFITAAASCSPDGHNIFFLTDGAPTCDDDKKTCTCGGTVQALGDVFSNLDADWGSIEVDDSDNTNGTSTCSGPPAATISGLPAAAPCSNDFDALLDAALGYYSGEDSDIEYVMQQIAPGAHAALSERSFLSALKSAAKVVTTVAKAVTKAVVTVVAPIVKAAEKVLVTIVVDAAKLAVEAAKVAASYAVGVIETYIDVIKFMVTGQYDKPFNIPLNLGPPPFLIVNSPWDGKKGFKFYHFDVDPKDSGYSLWDNAIDLMTTELDLNDKPAPGVDFWCIDCGVKGKITAVGSLSVRPGHFDKAQLKIKGNMYAGLFIGIDAFATIRRKTTHSLFELGLPGLSVPEIFTLGPSVSLGISAEARIELIGRVLTGASLNWENINGTIDFLDKSKTVTSGFTPVMNGTLQATKKSKLILSLGLPIALNFGLDILAGTWKKKASLTETPSLQAVANYEESLELTGTTEDGGCGIVDTTPSTKCFGVYWNISAVNDVELSLFDVVAYNLFHWESPAIAQGCVGHWGDNSGRIDTCSSDNSSSSASPSGAATLVATTPKATATKAGTVTSVSTGKS
jgi:hypothetical protein